MNRTHNPQIDNGLFVAEYYLKKDYKNITIEDLKENNELLCKILENTLKNKNITTCEYTTHLNSALTQPKQKILTQMSWLLDSIRNDKYCILCGEKTVNISIEIDRRYLEGIVSQTFFNHANNLNTVDVCPKCLYLSMLSVLNTQKIGSCILYISDNDNFMRDVTKDIQLKITKQSLCELKSVEKDTSFISACIDILNKQDIYDTNYIIQYCFVNGQNIYQAEKTIKTDQINLIRDIKSEGLLSEFISLNLFNNIYNNNSFVKSLINLYNYNKKCSKELSEILEEYEMSENEKKLVLKITNKLQEISIDKLKKELKLCDNKNKFESFLMKYQEEIKLFDDLNDIEEILSYKKWERYKNYILWSILIK
ncbi:MAG: hypothetical protein WCX96_03485 [Bacilli bacterium]